ncbi:hypothetical protein BGZ83_005455 [Gryganskiella cystojenkinii]|nr:hypothetical protein BGZ83_005455 [Gryganskiella cystojenkinii]
MAHSAAKDNHDNGKGSNNKKNRETDEQLYDPRSLQYLEPNQTSLQCSVCCEYFTEPVSAPCGHTFCRVCIMQALEVSHGCPLCRTTIDPTALYEVIALSRICDELLVYCPHKALGCNHACQRIQIGKHLKDDCIYIGTLCRVEECRKKLLKKDLSEHMESCPYKRVDCLMCNTKVMKSELSDHHKTCPAESVTCPHCETTRTRIRHLEHLKVCPKQIIGCSLSEFGCPWKGPRFDLDAIHIPQCPYESIRGFLEISKTRMEALEQENQQLRAIFLDLRPQVQQLREQVGQLSESFQLVTQHQQNQATSGFGDGFLEMNSPYDLQQQQPHGMLSRHESYDLSANGMENGDESLRAIIRNNSIGGESINSNANGNAVDTHELLISENERIRSEIETLTQGLASLELKQNMAIMTESMRMQEEVQSLRAVCHGLRMQMHYLLLEQQNSRHPHVGPGGPPPPGSPNNGAGAGNGGKGNNSGPPAGTTGGRPLSSVGMPRPRFADGVGRQDTKL